MKSTTKEICTKGLLTALVMIATMVFQIPVSATQGYIHLGDGMILIIGVFFGWRYGALAGGLGSALADILSGYPQWALFTLVIKAVMGAIAGLIGQYSCDQKHFLTFRNVFAGLVGVVWMIFGYYIAGGILQSSFVVSLASIPENMVQGAGGLLIYWVVSIALAKTKVCKFLTAQS